MGIRATIHSAGPEHLPEIIALAGIVWRAHYPGIISPDQIDYMLGRIYDVAVMRRELDSGIVYDRLLVDDELRAFSSYGATSAPGEMKVHKLYVHPNFQRRGLGSRLLAHAQIAARQRGFTTMLLAVNKRNEKAIAAYLKNGFTIRESVIVDIGGGFVMDDYVMAKAL